MKTSPREQAWPELPCRGGEGRTATQQLPAAPQQVTACRRGDLKETRPVDSCGKIRESSFASLPFSTRPAFSVAAASRWVAPSRTPRSEGVRRVPRDLPPPTGGVSHVAPPRSPAASPRGLSSRRPCGRATAKGLRRSGSGEARASAGRSSGGPGSSPARALPAGPPAGPCPAVP